MPYLNKGKESAMKLFLILSISVLVVFSFCQTSHAGDDAASNLLKQGLLGAATGAVASEVSGGKAGKGALVGAGVNIVGGMLFDAMSGQRVERVDSVQSMDGTEAFQRGYQAGYEQGFENGYNQGYKSGINYN